MVFHVLPNFFPFLDQRETDRKTDEKTNERYYAQDKRWNERKKESHFLKLTVIVVAVFAIRFLILESCNAYTIWLPQSHLRHPPCCSGWTSLDGCPVSRPAWAPAKIGENTHEHHIDTSSSSSRSSSLARMYSCLFLLVLRGEAPPWRRSIIYIHRSRSTHLVTLC